MSDVLSVLKMSVHKFDCSDNRIRMSMLNVVFSVSINVSSSFFLRVGSFLRITVFLLYLYNI